MNSDYSFIINKPIDYSCLDSTNQHISNSNYILNIISPTCEDCYVNLNKWELIASQNWRKRSIPTHLERHNPPTIIAKMGLKRA